MAQGLYLCDVQFSVLWDSDSEISFDWKTKRVQLRAEAAENLLSEHEKRYRVCQHGVKI